MCMNNLDMDFISNHEESEDSGDDSCDESSDIDKSCLQPTQLQNEQQHKQREIKVKNRWTKEEVCRHTQR